MTKRQSVCSKLHTVVSDHTDNTWIRRAKGGEDLDTMRIIIQLTNGPEVTDEVIKRSQGGHDD